MAVPIDLVALAVLPVRRWCAVAERLRRGDAPTAILLEQCTDGARLRSGPARWSDPAWVRARARQALAAADASGLAAVPFDDPRYPALLQQIADPPPVIWVAGETSAFDGVSVALVGSRAGSPHALAVAERLAADLASRGVVVVSGLARGVDSAAHQGALSVDGTTVAVLGSGADVVYPPEHDHLARAIVRRGAVVSELLPGTAPRAAYFPQRNRIISGLVRAVVVIEAGEKSGSLITARCALEQGRDVLAVPGTVIGGRNRGGHALLRDGARLVESADDVLDELGLDAARGAAGAAAVELPADAVLDAMPAGEPLTVGDLARRSGLAVPVLLPRLLVLELRGAVRRAAGGRFVRFGGNVLG